jgi:hypothetical protein
VAQLHVDTLHDFWDLGDSMSRWEEGHWRKERDMGEQENGRKRGHRTE